MTTLEYEEASLSTQLAPTAAVDEWWDHHVNRPVASLLVRGLAHTQMTANQVTILSGVTGISAAVCFALAQGYWPLLGGFLLLLTMVLDCADGQLARLRGGGSFIGRMMDGYVDWITAVAIHLGLWGYFATVGFNAFGKEIHGGLSTLLIAAACGITMAVHSMVYDNYKNRYRRLTGEGNSETSTPDDISRRIRNASSAGERFYLRLYWLYCKSQSSVAGDNTSGTERPEPAVARLRHKHLGRGLQLWSPIGPTTRLTILAFSGILAGYVSWGMYVYVVLAFGVANVYAAIINRVVRRIEARLESEEAALAQR